MESDFMKNFDKRYQGAVANYFYGAIRALELPCRYNYGYRNKDMTEEEIDEILIPEIIDQILEEVKRYSCRYKPYVQEEIEAAPESASRFVKYCLWRDNLPHEQREELKQQNARRIAWDYMKDWKER